MPHQTKLPYQTDADAALLPYLIHQLGSAHEWSGVWTGPYWVQTGRLTGSFESSSWHLVKLASLCFTTLQTDLLKEAAFADSVPDMDTNIILFIMAHRCTDTTKPRKWITTNELFSLTLLSLLLTYFRLTPRRQQEANWPHKARSLIQLSRFLTFSTQVLPSSMLTLQAPRFTYKFCRLDLHTFRLRIVERNSFKVINLVILITFTLGDLLMLLGENWYWSLLGTEGLIYVIIIQSKYVVVSNWLQFPG